MTDDRWWKITFNFYFDEKSFTEGCDNKLHTNTQGVKTFKIQEILQTDGNFNSQGLYVTPARWYYNKRFVVYYIEHTSLLMPDALELYADPRLKLGFYKVVQRSFLGTGIPVDVTSEEFYAFRCTMNGALEIADLEATPATQADNKFSCATGQTIFLGGTNTFVQQVYCSVTGWRGMDKNMILEQENSEKQKPHCWKDTPFMDCVKHSCFVFGDALVTKKKELLVKVKSPSEIQNKLGAYVEYSDDDKKWFLQLDYENMELTSFTIGKQTYDIGEHKYNHAIAGEKVTATITRAGPKLPSGRASKKFELKANMNQNTKELTELFGFYGSTENVIKLKFAEKTFTAKGVANHKVYKATGSNPNTLGETVDHDEDNLFICTGDKTIYLNKVAMKISKIRFTAKGWMNEQGIVVSKFIKDANGKDVVEHANCYSVCQGTTFTPQDPAPSKISSDKTIEISCAGKFVEVDGKTENYASVRCENDEWKGDGVKLDIVNNRFSAKCVGANDYVKVCSGKETKEGCTAVRKAGDKFECEPGFALLMDKDGADTQETIYSFLEWKKVGNVMHWMEGNKDHGASVKTLKPICYSKCMKDVAKVELVGPDATNPTIAEAVYKYNHESKIGKLTCTDTNVLLSALDGSEKNYVDGLICDNQGWKDGATVKKDFSNAASVKDLIVKAHCFKACHDDRVEHLCPASPPPNLDCVKASYSSKRILSCPPTHTLFVNDKESTRGIICNKKGWTLTDDDQLVIDYSTHLKEFVKAKCLAKCGSQFVTGKAPLANKRISCPGTQMITYKVNNGPEKETLQDLTCDETGWKAGTEQVVLFDAGTTPRIEANCKPSCDKSLIKPECDELRATGCAAASQSDDDKLTCAKEKWLLSEGKITAEMQCTKKAFETTEAVEPKLISIARKDPKTEARLTCISKCDNWFVDTDLSEEAITANKAGKLNRELKKAPFIVECANELYYTTMKTKEPAKIHTTNKFTCDPATGWTGKDTSITGQIDGKTLTVGCKNKCKDRIRPLVTTLCPAARGCKMPKDDDYKLKCEDPTHVLISLGVSGKWEEFGSDELQCKKDGFYHKDKRVLEFKAKAEEDLMPENLFDAVCVTKCDQEFVLPLDESAMKELNDDDIPFTGAKTRKKPADPLMCVDADSIILTKYGENTKVGKKTLFDKATCDVSTGWKDASSQFFFKFADFPGQFKIQAACVPVCDQAMIMDVCPELQDNICSPMKYTTKTLSCSAEHHRLFLNDKESKEEIAPTATMNKMKCSKKGWQVTDDTNVGEMMIDFTITNTVSYLTVMVHCKHKCHPDFVDISAESFPDRCRQGTSCTQAHYEGQILKCADPTEILVFEHKGTMKESWDPLTCSKDGWKRGSDVIFPLSDASLNYYAKAHCEQLCSPNVDDYIDPEGVSHHNYDPENKTLTCVDVNQMLKHDGNGVYSDLLCSKEGWAKTKKEFVDGKETGKLILDVITDEFKFTPIIDSTTEAAERTKRAKKFTCELNDCMRPNPCTPAELLNTDEVCINPDYGKEKYKMSCTSPSKLMKKAFLKSGLTPVSYDSLTCKDGAWMDGDTPLYAKLGDADLLKEVAERPQFEVICNTAACTSCKEESLTIITSSVDTNVKPMNYEKGSFKTCAGFKCTSSHYVVRDTDEDNKKSRYFYNDKNSDYIKCSATGQGASLSLSFLAPDGQSSVTGFIGCVQQIPCNEHSRIDTTCEKCEEGALDALLAVGSKLNTSALVPPVKCGDLGQMYHETVENDKTVWKVVKELQCNEKGEWKASIFIGKTDGETKEMTLKHTKDNDPAWRVICSLYDPNPSAGPPEFDPKTQTCLACADAANKLKCDDCKSYAASKNDGKGGCVMNIPSGYRFKIDGKKEVSGQLTCKMTNGVYEWKTAEGLKVNTLAVVSHAISTGAIVGIAFGVILVLGLIVFAMVFVAIRRKREQERLEKLKSKGLEQKQDTIIDNVTLVEDSKTLVL